MQLFYEQDESLDSHFVDVLQQVLKVSQDSLDLPEPQVSMDSLDQLVHQVRMVIRVLMDKLEILELLETRVPLARLDCLEIKVLQEQLAVQVHPARPDHKDSLEIKVNQVIRVNVVQLEQVVQMVNSHFSLVFLFLFNFRH